MWYYGWTTLLGGTADGKTYCIGYVIENLESEPVVSEEKNFYYKKNDRLVGMTEKGRKKYTVLRISSPEEWRSKVKMDEYQLVVIDHIFGTACLTLDKIEKWQLLFDEIVIKAALSQNKLKVIIAYNQNQERSMPPEFRRSLLFQPDNVLDINDYRYSSDRDEKKRIYCRYSGHTYKNYDETPEEMNLHNIHTSFPFVVRLFTSSPCLKMRWFEFFRNPLHCLQEFTDMIYDFDRIMFYTIAFCVFKDGNMDLSKPDFTDYDANTQYILKQLRQMIPIPDDTDMAMIRFAAETLQSFCFYTSQRTTDGNYIFPQERYMQAASTSVYRKDPKRFIQLCSISCLCERVRTSSCIEIDNASVNVYPSEYETLAQRYTYEVLSGHVKRIASLPCCHDNNFGQVWATFMDDMGSMEDVLRQEDEHSKTFLFWIAHYGCNVLIKSFLEAESLEEVREEDWFKKCLQQGMTGSANSNFMDSTEAVKTLVAYGIDPNQIYVPDEDEDVTKLFGYERSYLIQMEATPIQYAAHNGKDETIKYLVKAGVDINSVAKDGFTPLHRSVLQKYAHNTKILLELKADFKIKSPDGITAFMEACLAGNRDACKYLLTAGTDVKLPPHPIFGSALLCSMASGHENLTGLLIDHGTDKVEKKDPWSPLHYAVTTRQVSLVEILITEKGLPLEARGRGGLTPLHVAVIFDNYDMVLRLFKMKGFKPEVDARTNDGKTSLHLASELGLYKMCEELLDRGASPDAKTHEGYYPLNLAARNGHLSIVLLFLEEGLELELPANSDKFFEENPELMSMMGPHGMRMMGGPMGMMDPDHMMMMMMMKRRHRDKK